MNILDELGIQVVQCGDSAGDRPYERVKAWTPSALYFNAETDRLVNAALMAECTSTGYRACAYFVFPRSLVDRAAGVAYAERASARVTELQQDEGARVEIVMHDVEKVPLEAQAGFLDRWDQLRPWRPTIYNVEPFQDGTQNDYARMLRRNQQGLASGRGRIRKLTAQTYFGGMQPLRPRDVAEYLTVRAIGPDDLTLCTDPAQPAAYLTSTADAGCRGLTLFQAGRIPR